MFTLAPNSYTASATLTRSDANRIGLINAAAGLTLTLPAATGTGDMFRFYVGTTVTSNSVVIKVANSTDVMAGTIISAADAGATSNAWEAASTDDTITFNGTTTGGLRGDWIHLVDVASGFWSLHGITASTGTEATPLSATV